MKTTKFLAAIAFVALLGGTAACGSGLEATASEVTFDVQAIEIKGSTDGIDPPSVDPTTLSLGYRFKPAGEVDPENPDKWQVSTYLFSPGSMSVVKGDDVTLRVFGVNGDEHTMWVTAPDGSTVVEEHLLNRGRELSLNFKADQAGHYTLHCGEHAPTMSADILSVG